MDILPGWYYLGAFCDLKSNFEPDFDGDGGITEPFDTYPYAADPDDLDFVFTGEDDDAVDIVIENTGQYEFDGFWHTTTHNDYPEDEDS